MKKIITIVLTLLLFLQAIPVMNFFVSENVYTYVDEDKPGELKMKDKKECKEFISPGLFLWPQEVSKKNFEHLGVLSLTSPYLKYITPPPDCVA